MTCICDLTDPIPDGSCPVHGLRPITRRTIPVNGEWFTNPFSAMPDAELAEEVKYYERKRDLAVERLLMVKGEIERRAHANV